jgi:hypothetical protein
MVERDADTPCEDMSVCITRSREAATLVLRSFPFLRCGS